MSLKMVKVKIKKRIFFEGLQAKLRNVAFGMILDIAMNGDVRVRGARTKKFPRTLRNRPSTC